MTIWIKELCDTTPEVSPGSVAGKVTVLFLISTFVEGGFVIGFTKWLTEGSVPGERIPNVLEAKWVRSSFWVKSSRIWTFTIFWNEPNKESKTQWIYHFKETILIFKTQWRKVMPNKWNMDGHNLFRSQSKSLTLPYLPQLLFQSGLCKLILVSRLHSPFLPHPGESFRSLMEKLCAKFSIWISLVGLKEQAPSFHFWKVRANKDHNT